MKNIFRLCLLAAIMTVGSVSFISCGDDNDDPQPIEKPDTSTPAKIGVMYELQLSDAWWDFFDIQVTYVKADGSSTTEPVAKGWSYAATAPYKDAVGEYGFTANATPKADHSEIVADQVYRFEAIPKATLFVIDSKDDMINSIPSIDSHQSLSIHGSKLDEYLKPRKVTSTSVILQK